ncbi:uncharacterized protein UBRO_20078 [Ustilago bromivora]|uniref:Uncharacterized protein n=1 Tax=Ustilago bromivora TaxID=307758 RepID=A0A1K0HJL0_9BASI|nr:uncharacterized protein UBRO_20078 [Ustilago bromivora]SYW78140.1 uncharacterized protein UBRO2_02332 [Ustilago bromivora]
MARRGLQDQQPREASSDASLWEELDDPINAFDGISTPPLPSSPTQVVKILGATRKSGSKRGRSSLLDQTDAIKCQVSSGSSVQAGGKTTDACQPLRPSKSAKTNGKARATAEEIDKVVADDMLNTLCSPPSSPPPGPRIKSISDMPAEEQQSFYLLAFGGGSSSSSSPGNMGVTSRGKNDKIWQTTWDNSNQPSTSTVSLAATSRPNLASGSSSSRGVAKGSPSSTSSGAIRGREPSASTVEARTVDEALHRASVCLRTVRSAATASASWLKTVHNERTSLDPSLR